MVIDSPAASRGRSLLEDLEAEHAALDSRVAGLSPDEFATPTPAIGWSVADQISHLAYFDRSATLAINDRAAFELHRSELFRTVAAEPDVALGRFVASAELLASWREARSRLLEAARDVLARGELQRVAWYGPEMGFLSFLTARLMETWAHGQDVADALGLPPVVSARLRHVIHLGVAARAHAFAVHGVTDPGDPVVVRTRNPLDETDVWVFGDEDAAGLVSGSALGLALVFTQRRKPEEADVRAEGATAELFLSVAQAFAGPPGPTRRGRRAG